MNDVVGAMRDLIEAQSRFIARKKNPRKNL